MKPQERMDEIIWEEIFLDRFDQIEKRLNMKIPSEEAKLGVQSREDAECFRRVYKDWLEYEKAHD